jgi:hypothetical protein
MGGRCLATAITLLLSLNFFFVVTSKSFIYETQVEAEEDL